MPGRNSTPQFKGTEIPYLSEMIDAIKGKSILVCEIKSGAVEHEAKILALIKEKQIEEAVTIISFSEQALKNFRKLDHDIITMYLKGSPREKIDGKTVYHPIPLSILDEAEELDVDALNLHSVGVTPELVEAAHQRGFKVFCYTVQ